MSTFKAVLAGVSLAVAALAPASAAVVQGIPVTDAIIEVDSGSFRQNLNLNTGELTGFGLVSSFNNNTILIPAGRELTYSFSGFFLDEPNSSINRLIFTGGTVTLYSDGTPNFNINNGATATDSEFAMPFLTLAGSFFIDIVNTTVGGTLSANLLSGFTALDVTGGAAAPYFDTNALAVLVSLGPPPVFGMVDVTGSTSLVNYFLNGSSTPTAASAFANSVLLAAIGAGVNPNDTTVNVLDFFKTTMQLTSIEGTGSADFNVKVIPEPGTLALLGFGALALGLARRRKGGTAE
ncbi:PEP-CTERM sorting domain-containing protein [Calidifontimicrobium sp. SYSU G02091]|uniref:PEP-CTERM sorting domain-containing protein n=1 Tax=Calidifontimicrobium sp. SYSU G02091 TaxID=2926421 RepID=UPI001F53A127|nr:PEP-CTERM sorting domain-containing protein [Calidifontimicrobium sp. SYSU G02091]MCI1193112.1 PEP-CTERM sorting domain-containing protein [Calidifontimicrobium sp. SYSU G02091]